MRWTPTNDQLLLLKILETHDLSVDTKRVAAAWPISEGEDRPTPRAIAERLVRMRQAARASGGVDAHFSIGKGMKNSSPITTPRKSRKTGTASTPGSSKRKRSKNDSDEEELAMLSSSSSSSSPAVIKHENGIEPDTPTKGKIKKQLAMRTAAVAGSSSQGWAVGERKGKVERAVMAAGNVNMMEGPGGSPTKRVRKASVLPAGMVSWKSDDDEPEVESSASEYVPEVEVKGEEVEVDVEEDAEYV
ncbi:hypothetical protein BO94DRAFT_581269 [Aspergillus sclerotioniger CBS 115572]|uniref:Uncharacterized protein n=1 Tax=Aspergillus sclerotioniger CBS 115572 TaxID=1450535 RepID=A0A317X8N5_9EURO|nr:hypothetical protein BO94DRAFT_581269 [Aspergillus sclerotioniger CBS 115572]PWY94919.1 hypothetical protein BO94DRAFT_581269 [Aspergillus sclerotioniger CBS 115572]